MQLADESPVSVVDRQEDLLGLVAGRLDGWGARGGAGHAGQGEAEWEMARHGESSAIGAGREDTAALPKVLPETGLIRKGGPAGHGAAAWPRCHRSRRAASRTKASTLRRMTRTERRDSRTASRRPSRMRW